MNQPAVLIKAIRQKDNVTFEIEWSDGEIVDYRLSALQKRCSCAQCFDPAAGRQRTENQKVDEDVRAVKLTSVGRYALRIQFTSGCSQGIYSFAMLRQLVKEKVNV